MTTARGGHTATLLTNGKVLIAGGAQWSSTASVPLASAELYDLATGSFTATGSMNTARSGHRATLLPNGKVLITGGRSGVSSTGTLDSAEVYDPSTGAFTATGKMTTARDFHTTTLLNSGKVLIAGGSRALGRAELYDLSTGTFAATGSMTQGEWVVTTATLLNNGVVLIAGAGGSEARTAELYDPATGTFGPAGNGAYGYPVPLTSTLLTNAQVLDTLQNSCDNSYIGTELYDFSLRTFTPTGNMTTYRGDRTATLLPDGTVLVTGGGFSPGGRSASIFDVTPSAELYNPDTGRFSPTGSMTVDRSFLSATLLPDGTVLIAAGESYPSGVISSLASAELYHPVVLVPSPVLLSLSGDGQGQGAIQHANTYRIASATDPAVAGEYLSIYLTGLTDGGLIPPQVAIGGRLAEITFFGNVPGYPGLNVINIRMPGGVVQGSEVPVRLTYLGRSSNAVTIGAQ
jgi:hypothetical protein